MVSSRSEYRVLLVCYRWASNESPISFLGFLIDEDEDHLYVSPEVGGKLGIGAITRAVKRSCIEEMWWLQPSALADHMAYTYKKEKS